MRGEETNNNIIYKGGHKDVTGFETLEEYYAFEQGKYAYEKVVTEWIQNWDGKTNSVLGQILYDKFVELNNNERNRD